MPALIAPFGFILARVAFAGSLFWILALYPGFREKIDKKDWPRFALCALFGVAVNQLSFFKGLSYTLPIHASLMQLTSPICVTIIAAIIIKEKLTFRKMFGLLLGISGALLLILFTQENSAVNASNIPLGNFLVFVNAVSYACYLVIVKPLMQRYKPVVVIRYVFTIGFFYVLPLSFNEFWNAAWDSFKSPDWLALGYVVLFTTFFAYLFNVLALHALRASTVGSYIYLQPVFASIVAIIFFGEEVTPLKVVAALFIFAGVYVISYKRKAVQESPGTNDGAP